MKTFDILLLGETWQNKNDMYDFGISDYECAHVYAQKPHGVKRVDTAAAYPCTIDLH